MYYVVTYSTDMRNKQTQIKKFTSEKAAIRFAKIDNGNFTYADPESARNWHHTFKKVYEFSGRLDKKWIDKEKTYSSPTYPCTENDAIHSYLYRFAQEVELS